MTERDRVQGEEGLHGRLGSLAKGLDEKNQRVVLGRFQFVGGHHPSEIPLDRLCHGFFNGFAEIRIVNCLGLGEGEFSFGPKDSLEGGTVVFPPSME